MVRPSHSWLGTDGHRVLQVTARTWKDARAQIDSFLKGNAGIGRIAGYKNVRSRLPEQASILALVSGQGLVRCSRLSLRPRSTSRT